MVKITTVYASFLRKRYNDDELAQSRVHWTSMEEVAGSNPGRTNTQGFYITEEKGRPL